MPSDARVVQPFYWLLGSAAAVVVIAGLRAAQPLVVPFLIAAFLAVICAPALHWLQKKGVPSWLAILLVALAVSMVVFFVVSIMTGSINGFISKVPNYQQNLQTRQEQLSEWVVQIQRNFGVGNKEEAADAETVEDKDPDMTETPDAPLSEDTVEEGTADDEKNNQGFSISELILERLDSSAVLRYLQHALLSLTGVFGNVFLVLLTVLFMLLESSGFPSKLRALSSRTENLNILEQAEKIRESIVHYVSLKTLLSLLTSVLVGVWVWYLGIDFPMLWAMLAFFLNFIPNIGSILAAVPPMLLALVQYQFNMMLITGFGYVVINVGIGNMIEPRVMGKGLGLSTLVVFLSLVFWGWVLGPVGMLFAVPLTMIVKIIMESFEETRWIAILVGTNPEVAEQS